jgi:hypothetical protein
MKPAPIFSISSLLVLLANACTSSSNPSDAGAAATCAAPGAATPGQADTHCSGGKVQTTSMASCHPQDAAAGDGGTSSGDDGGAPCPYGDTAYGQESDDDDCKYHVTWSARAICEGVAGVPFTVVATNKTDGSPLTGAGTVAEVFTTSPGSPPGCDNTSSHPGPNSGVVLTEGPAGTYKGNIVFDAPGQWTVRFHFHEECADLLDDSPHGHAAYHLTVP